MAALVEHYYFVALFWCLFSVCKWTVTCQALAKYRSEEEQMILSKNMTYILNYLVQKDLYDKRLRPNYGGPAVDVNITMHVSSLSHVSEVEMDYTLDIYLRQSWIDPRLTWKNVPVKEITISVEYMKHIWVPDTFFPNEKKSYFHKATTHNSFLRISEFGQITTSQRITVTASCAMDLHYFPLDTQVCTLEIESYGYSADDIKLLWARVPKPADVDNNTELPTFMLKQPLMYEEKTEVLSTGAYSRLSCKFEFERTLGFYWIQIYQPSMLIVIISWVTFWINRDSAPARVTLGIMTVLTMTTLMTTTNKQMPKVSYVKAVDIYLVVCYIMVFAALLEYAVVSYSNKKKQDESKRVRQKQTTNIVQQSQLNESSPPNGKRSTTSDRNNILQRKVQVQASDAGFLKNPTAGSHQNYVFDGHTTPVFSQANSVDNMGFCGIPDITPNPSMIIPEDPRTSTVHEQPIIDESEFTRLNFTVNKRTVHSRKTASRNRKRRITSCEECMRQVAGSVDKYSRMIFPLIFTMFNVFYWLWFLKASGKL